MNKSKYFLIPFYFGLMLCLSLGLMGVNGYSETGKIITLYQNGPSLVVENEKVKLEEGLNGLTRPVPGSVVAETVFATSPEATLRTSEIISAIDSESKLLKELIGTTVSVVKSKDSGTLVTGTLVNVLNGRPLLRTSDGKMRLIRNPGEYRFDKLSADDMDARLELNIMAPVETRTKLTIGYQLSGLNWSPQYVGFLDEEKGTLNLQGIAHISNRTGWNFRGVRLRLLAGKPKREESDIQLFAAARTNSKPESSRPEKVFEYYRYKIGFPVNLSSGVEKQVKFLQEDSVNYRKYYLFEPYSSSAVKTMVELDNKEESGLGLPIASGTIRIYEASPDKTFLGADSLPNLPVGRKAELELGDAFDVKGERKRTSHEKVAEGIWKDRIEITLENKKDKSVKVLIEDKLPGDWKIIQSSHDYEKVDSRIISYEESISEGGSIEISYVVQYKL
ncbi:MAG: DUF4139 domain-containing protein [Candidatus Bipolaricaulia bacterium]